LSEADQNQGIAPDLIPASMLAAFAYCPRLCYIQWVQGEFQDSAETVDGRLQHAWVDAEQDAIPEDFQPFHARSVSLSAPQAGVCCRIDLLEGDGDRVTPVEYKRGAAPAATVALWQEYACPMRSTCCERWRRKRSNKEIWKVSPGRRR
jgi:hypothetical protein